MTFHDKVKRLAIQEGKYRQMAEMFSEEFGWDDIVVDAFMKTAMANNGEIDETFDFILDSPMVSQFRLRWSNDGFKVVHYPFAHLNDERDRQANRITRQIQEIEDD